MNQRTLFLALAVIIFGAGAQYGQIPPPDNSADLQRMDAEKRIQAERDLRMRQMRELDTAMKAKKPPERTVAAGPTIDKATSERIRLARRIDAGDYARYTEFLKGEKTGIFKLFPDYDCVSKDVIKVDGNCKDFVFASSSWSFRTVSYSHPLYHDLGYNHGEIYSNAFFSQGILVALGDVPIENATQDRAGMKFLIDFEIASDPAKARNAAVRLKTGIESGGFTYASHFTPAENMTYALRSISYNIANSLPPVSDATSMSEMRFHTLAMDKRADEIVVFRVVRKGADGGLTIVWRELSRSEAPKIKFAKGEKFVDFKPETPQPQ